MTPQYEFGIWNNGEDVDFGRNSATVPLTSFGDLPPLPDLPVDNVAQQKGSEPTVQIFYEGPERCDCCINWIEKPPTQMPESERNRYDQAAICVYKRKDHQSDTARIGGIIDIKDEKVIIQSRFLIDLIRPALVACGFPVPKEGDLEFKNPFKELYFAHSRILKTGQQLPPNSDEQKHVNLLISVMNSLFTKTSASVSRMLSKRMITYAYLWTLFPKNMVVYSKQQEQDRLYQIVEAGPRYSQYKTKPNHEGGGYERTEQGFAIQLRQLAFDGTNFGILEHTVLIEIYEGERPINRLIVYPVGFHTDKDRLEQNMTSRGSKVLDFQTIVHCEFEGSAQSVLRDEYALVCAASIPLSSHGGELGMLLTATG